MKLNKSGSPGLTDAHIYTTATASLQAMTRPVLFIGVDKFVFCNATIESTCLLSVLDFHTRNVNMSIS